MAKVNFWYELGPFTVFDVETTGMNARNHRIVEIAAVHIAGNGSISRYESLVNPGCLIPPEAAGIHRITDDMVASAPLFRQVGFEFLDFAAESTLVAHNARFDLAFLQESLARCGLPLWKGNTMDSLKLFKQAYSGLPSYSLQNLRQTFKLRDPGPGMQAHRAAADAEWTTQLLEIALTALIANLAESS
ncbi:MAG: 3'-5' exonuclease [Victivallales bacterium]|nr:3'-5' exonuclease [Victivallales bacterium]